MQERKRERHTQRDEDGDKETDRDRQTDRQRERKRGGGGGGGGMGLGRPGQNKGKMVKARETRKGYNYFPAHVKMTRWRVRFYCWCSESALTYSVMQGSQNVKMKG